MRSTLPNLITFSRFVLAPFAVRAILAREFTLALALFAAAALTDVLDGILARWLKATSRLGAYMDPIADKVLLSASYLALGLEGAAPWWLVGLVFGRDLFILAMAGAALAFTHHRDFPPSIWGKLSTVCQSLAALGLIVSGAFPVWGISTAPLIWLAAVATVWSGLDYAWRGVRLLAKTR